MGADRQIIKKAGTRVKPQILIRFKEGVPIIVEIIYRRKISEKIYLDNSIGGGG